MQIAVFGAIGHVLARARWPIPVTGRTQAPTGAGSAMTGGCG
jgi:hypothetical protein